MRGPANPSLNDECAFLLEGFDKPPTIMMPYTQPYYLEFMERYGFRKAKDLYSLLKKVEDGIPQRIEKMIERIKKKTRVRIRPFDMKNFRRDIQFIKDIYNSAWEKNWGFVPMTDKEMDLTAKNICYLFAIPLKSISSNLSIFFSTSGRGVSTDHGYSSPFKAEIMANEVNSMSRTLNNPFFVPSFKIFLIVSISS